MRTICMKPGCETGLAVRYSFVSDDARGAMFRYCAPCMARALDEGALSVDEVRSLEKVTRPDSRPSAPRSQPYPWASSRPVRRIPTFGPDDLQKIQDLSTQVREISNALRARIVVEVWDSNDLGAAAWLETHPDEKSVEIRFSGSQCGYGPRTQA